MKINFILNSFQFFVVDNGYTTADDSTEARVRIKKLTYDQVGGYTCRAQNKLGSAEKKFDVQLGSQTDCNIGLCESYSSAGSAGLNTNGIVFGISLIGSVILFMTVKWTLFTTHSEKKIFSKNPATWHSHHRIKYNVIYYHHLYTRDHFFIREYVLNFCFRRNYIFKMKICLCVGKETENLR